MQVRNTGSRRHKIDGSCGTFVYRSYEMEGAGCKSKGGFCRSCRPIRPMTNDIKSEHVSADFLMRIDRFSVEDS